MLPRPGQLRYSSAHMPVHITNPSVEPATLPYPLRGTLRPGQAVVLDYTLAQIEARCPNVKRTFLVKEIPSSSFDSDYDQGAEETSVEAAIGGFSRVRTVTGSWSFELADKGGLVIADIAAPANGTIPSFATVAFPLGTVLSIEAGGAGQATFVAGAGVNPLKFRLSAKTAGEAAIISAVHKTLNTWTVFGDVAAS